MPKLERRSLEPCPADEGNHFAAHFEVQKLKERYENKAKYVKFAKFAKAVREDEREEEWEEEWEEERNNKKFVCVTKDPEYWGSPWNLNDFDPQSDHKCEPVDFQGEMCSPCHQSAKKFYPALKDKFRDSKQYIGFPCVWKDPNYEKVDAKIRPGWQRVNALLEIVNVRKPEKVRLDEWNIENEQDHIRNTEEAVCCMICWNRINECPIKDYVFNKTTRKLNPTWEDAVRRKRFEAGVEKRNLHQYEGYLLNFKDYFPRDTDNPNKTERRPSIYRKEYQEVNESKTWGEHKVPLLRFEDDDPESYERTKSKKK